MSGTSLGYSIGGPIRKDKTFFFFNQEFQRFVTTLTGTATVPTAAFKTGVFNFTYIDPNTLGTTTVPVDLTPSSTNNVYGLPLDLTMQQVLALYPDAPQSADGVSGTIHYPSSSRTSGYQTVAKIDHHFTERQTLSIRYGYDHSFDPNPFHDDILPGNLAATSSKSISQGLSANLVSSLSSNLLNSFNFGWNKIYANFKCTGLGTLDSVSPLDQFGNGRDYNMDPFTSFGCLSIVSDSQFRKTGTTSYSDSISWVHGAHTLKFGGDFRNVHENGPNSFLSRRQVDVNTFAIFGDPVDAGFNFIDIPGVTDQAGIGFAVSDAASALYGFVAQDQNAEFFNKSGTRVATDDKLFRQHEYDWFAQDYLEGATQSNCYAGATVPAGRSSLRRKREYVQPSLRSFDHISDRRFPSLVREPESSFIRRIIPTSNPESDFSWDPRGRRQDGCPRRIRHLP